MLACGKIDVVVIATPHYFHPIIGMDAFRAGLNVISEKPIGVYTKNVVDFIKVAKESGKVFGARLAVRIMCGSSPWDAWLYVHPEDAHLGVIARKEKADGVYQQDSINDFVRWAKQRSAELYALDLKAWDWSFKDSEMSLRLLIACSEEQLKQLKGNVTQTISNTMLGAIRELNKMYEYDGANYYAEKARAVIFLHEDALED
jgi:hypothetical protein